MLDLVIRHGSVIDGSGRAAQPGDLGIKEGRIAAIGNVEENAASVIDATGLVVCPGFVDLHTHYDPHVMWDSGVTPSSLHGVTSIVGGNCGFTLAPITADAAAYLVPMLARVEGMPLQSLEACLDLDWDTFDSWLARLNGRLAVNAGFLVGHSTLRRVVMGEDAVGRNATDDELDQMTRLLHEALEQGGLGFSSSHGPVHTDHRGDKVPSRWANREELVALSAALSQHVGTVLEFIPSSLNQFSQQDIETMAAMSAAAQRSLNWNLLVVMAGADRKDVVENRLSASDYAASAGAKVRALTLPMGGGARLNFLTGFVYDSVPRWKELIFSLPPAERLLALRDPSLRTRLQETAKANERKEVVDWAKCLISDVSSPDLRPFVGRRVGKIARERGVDPFDALIDIVVEDELLTGIEIYLEDNDDLWQQRLELWRNDRTIVGGSDSGAHLDMLKTFCMHTKFLAEAVRERQLLPLEEAIWHVTDVPARFYGLKGRGRIAEGWCADLVVFDPDTVGPGEVEFRADLPAGGRRLYSEPVGVECTVVNGVVTSRDGKLTGDTPGRVLRSGIDTEPVPLS